MTPRPHVVDALDRKIVAFYRDTLMTLWRAPTYAEIAAHVGFASKASAFRRVEVLRDAGLIPYPRKGAE